MTTMIPETELTPAAALDRLEKEISKFSSLVVAFSGGVDSTVLLAASARVLGDRVVALTADSPSMARSELREAEEIARSLGVSHRVVATNEMAIDEYVRNDGARCFFCKQTLFTTAKGIADESGIDAIAYGYTKDDEGDYRPGHNAATAAGIHAPLHAAGLGKKEIRAIARHLGLPVHQKPAAPCLASRIPYGSEVTEAKLSAIESMEALLHGRGFRICRARYDGSTMRVEVERHEVARAATPEIREAIVRHAIELGIGLIVLDLEGFASGKLNRAL